MAREDEVRLIAYNLWEKEGCTSDRDCEYWYRAESIWEQQHQHEPAAARSRPARSSSKTSRKTKSSAERKKSSPASKD